MKCYLAIHSHSIQHFLNSQTTRLLQINSAEILLFFLLIIFSTSRFQLDIVLNHSIYYHVTMR